MRQITSSVAGIALLSVVVSLPAHGQVKGKIKEYSSETAKWFYEETVVGLRFQMVQTGLSFSPNKCELADEADSVEVTIQKMISEKQWHEPKRSNGKGGETKKFSPKELDELRGVLTEIGLVRRQAERRC